MTAEVESTLWMYVWLALLVFLLRKDIAAEWRAAHPRRGRPFRKPGTPRE
jgi:hypothetical protein